MDYRKILTAVINSSQTPLTHGETIVCIWNNEEHLREWALCQNVHSESVRLVRLPSAFMPMLSTGNEKREDVCIIALGLGTQKDYSDTRCIFHMITKEE